MTPAWYGAAESPVLDLGIALGITRQAWVSHEQTERIALTRDNLATEATAGLRAVHLTSLADIYRDALICRFRLGDLVALEAHIDLTDEDIARFQEVIDGQPTVTFEFILDKQRLIDRDLHPDPAWRTVLYLFPEELERSLSGTLQDIEQILWPNDAVQKAVILLPGHEIWLDGPFLSILGGPSIPDLTRLQHADIQTSQHVRWCYETCRSTLKWQDDWVQRLTPHHLIVSGQATGTIHQALLSHQANSVILYTADRTMMRGAQWVSSYADPHQRIDLELAQPGQVGDDELRSGASSLLDLADWTYDATWFGDRLPLVQLAMVQFLRTAEPPARYRAILRSAPGIVASAKWHWKAIVSGKIEAYSEEIRNLEDYVALTTQTFAEQTDAMISRLSATMLAAVGVLLGSFVAALFEDDFNVTIFRIGLFAFSAYVLLFPFIFGMLHEWQRFRSLDTAFENRRGRFEELLPQDRVEEIIGQRVVASASAFRRWFCAVKIVYMIVIIAAVVVAITVLEWMPFVPVE